MATEKLINDNAPLWSDSFHRLVFAGTLLIYNVHSYTRLKPGERRGLGVYSPRYRLFHLAFAVAGLALVLMNVYILSVQMIMIFGILGLFSFAYSLPLLPLKNKRRIREFGWLKITALAGVWTIVTSVLPVISAHQPVSQYPYEIILRFAFIFSLCIIFDLRDITDDRANNINTLPSRIGPRNSYRLVNGAILLFVLISGMQYVRFLVWQRFAGALITGLATWAVAQYLRRRPTERGYLLLADGLMILYALLVLYLH